MTYITRAAVAYQPRPEELDALCEVCHALELTKAVLKGAIEFHQEHPLFEASFTFQRALQDYHDAVERFADYHWASP